MENKEALFYNSVTDPYVVNYVWLYGDSKDKQVNNAQNTLHLGNTRNSAHIGNRQANYLNALRNQVPTLNDSEKREDLTN
ncbi:hypothetical protein POVWA2_018470 [Plasmodium ovale wallikeri]|uniref:Uncharacterized protein n=2 Tax=Plasmodium ovale TaxID=36330 RepID=A0A1A8YQ19_PLAOA|nr:hypothetical protein POVWA1_018580 [Plasmodium ovale wallikeri]SBT34140.1 hypothetical protein POVWA2_018470 [Plasmodium ovale wallikeri]SBT76472.1 hypothetical protein POWCR01_070029900 [Plasmodium ovale]